MSSGFTLQLPINGGTHLLIFYPFFNNEVAPLIYERVSKCYYDNYVPIGNVVRKYLEISKEHAGVSKDMVEFIGNFDQHMHSTRPVTSEEYMTNIALLYDLIEDNPSVLTRPMHDQFFARLLQLLKHEEHIIEQQYDSFRGFLC